MIVFLFLTPLTLGLEYVLRISDLSEDTTPRGGSSGNTA